jgi:transposase
MAKRQTRTYTKEFKTQAVQLAEQPDITVNQAAHDLGIPNHTLKSWIKQSRRTDRPAFTGRGVPALSETEKRIQELERENAVLRQEREILKAAAKFFVREMK